MRVIIAAAGTGGHINPGIAIANKIKEKEKDSEIIFIGTARGLENDLVTRAGYKLETIGAYGLSKKISIDNIKKMFKTIRGYGEAKKIIKDFKPDVVIGTGGYICGATISSAHKLGIPTVLHESNAFPGKAIKLLANKTDLMLISFEDARKRIKNAKKIVYTGTPVKIKNKQYEINERKKIIEDESLSTEKPIVLVFGGSQGAKKINEAFLEIIKNELNKEYQIFWSTGIKQYDIMKQKLSESNINIRNIKNAKVVPYIYNMEEIMNVSDLIVARSGAMTITEISNLGKPSILIPLPNVSGDHQLYNAKVLENIGAAKIILNDELDGQKLNREIFNITLNKEIKDKMANSALSLSNENAEEKIYIEIKNLLNKN